MLMLKDDEKKWYKQRARLWAKGRKAARENIKALKEVSKQLMILLLLLYSIQEPHMKQFTRMPSQQLSKVILTSMEMLLLKR